MSLRSEFRELGLCPACSTPVEYAYVMSGPEGEALRVIVSVECPICGHKESRGLLFPLNAVYLIRYLFRPTVGLFLERVKVTHELKRAEELKAPGARP
ncbi:MAG: hypothetical protein N3F67_02245 [Acidilobaceae archaeon]|nr:hypothetical protein [Acidilobaceae archaeon]